MEKFYEDEYFYWLLHRVRNRSHYKLLRFLFETAYIFTIPMDENRADDGIQLRYEYIYEKGINEDEFRYLNEPCNLFEMMLALAVRISLIMDNPNKGDDTHVWFWKMISNLGLNKSTDNNFNLDYVQNVIRHFLTRKYGPNGRGGLFFVRSEKHIEDLQLWEQAMLYLNEIEERRRPYGTLD